MHGRGRGAQCRGQRTARGQSDLQGHLGSTRRQRCRVFARHSVLHLARTCSVVRAGSSWSTPTGVRNTPSWRCSEAIARGGLTSRHVDDVEGETARLLAEGKVVGWYQGRMEWGPRALGNRSILADPRRADMKDVINSKVKFREPYRPFAPSVLQEHVENYFHFTRGLAVHDVRVPGAGREASRDSGGDACRRHRPDSDRLARAQPQILGSDE